MAKDKKTINIYGNKSDLDKEGVSQNYKQAIHEGRHPLTLFEIYDNYINSVNTTGNRIYLTIFEVKSYLRYTKQLKFHHVGTKDNASNVFFSIKK